MLLLPSILISVIGQISILCDICQLFLGYRADEPRRIGFEQDIDVFEGSLAGFRNCKSKLLAGCFNLW